MKITKTEYAKTFFFLLFFGFISSLLISKYSFVTGTLSTLLVWSFYTLCIPFSGSGIITSKIIYLLTKKSVWYAGIIPWFLAIFINIFTYFVIPQSYLRLTTTSLLYRIISNPWPYWLIIVASSMGSLYNIFLIKTNAIKFSLKHRLAKIILIIVGILTLLYLSYFELIILISANIH